jgi:GT2 family glycosyltransferase
VLEPTTVSTWIAERDKLDQRWVLEHPRAPWGQTANLGVRRAAFEAAGGFDATIRWGEECDLCWRIQDAGWRLEPRLDARVDHHNRETLRALVRQMSRHGRGTEWLNERYPGAFPRPSARALAGTARAFARDGVRALRAGDGERAKFSVLDLISHVAFETGRRLTNEPPR